MITISINGNETHCQSEKEARKALRLAVAADAKASKIKHEKQALATQRAEAAAFLLLRACADMEYGSKRGWTLARADGTEYEQREYLRIVKRLENQHYDVSVDTEHGTFKHSTYGYVPEVIVITGCGYPIAMKFRNLDIADDSHWYGIGVCEDKSGYAIIEGRLAGLANELIGSILDYRAAKQAVA